MPPLLGVSIALAVVLPTAWFAGAAFTRFLRQPPVVGEIVAGLALGPSLLGRLAPGLSAALFPGPVVEALELLSRCGVVLFLFLVGLELDPRALRRDAPLVLRIAAGSVVVPLLAGALFGWVVYDDLAPPGVGRWLHAAFIGVAISITAFPVLARIVADRGLQRTRIGRTALSCAALNDATAWILLLAIVGLARADRDPLVGAGFPTALLGVGILCLLLVVVPPFVRTQQASEGPLGRGALAVLLAMLLGAASAAQAIGVHALFGAFALGVSLPHEGRLPTQTRARLDDLVRLILLPPFFVVTGLRTDFGALVLGGDVGLALLVVAIAAAGKIGGTVLGARGGGFGMRDTLVIAVLMNTRGLMELVVLQIGLDLGLIESRAFTLLAFMAIVTTIATAPVLDYSSRRRDRPGRPPVSPCAAGRPRAMDGG